MVVAPIAIIIVWQPAGISTCVQEDDSVPLVMSLPNFEARVEVGEHREHDVSTSVTGSTASNEAVTQDGLIGIPIRAVTYGREHVTVVRPQLAHNLVESEPSDRVTRCGSNPIKSRWERCVRHLRLIESQLESSLT